MLTQLQSDWIKALEDGSHQQTTKRLNCDGKFCCLGVLLDVIDKTKWSFSTYGIGTWTDGMGFTYVVSLPQEISERVGLKYTDVETLVEWNDSLNKTFPEIAQFLRELFERRNGNCYLKYTHYR